LIQFRFAGCQGGLGAFESQLEVIGFQTNQQCAFFHMLVVFHQHCADAGTQLAGYAGDFGLNVRIVGVLVKAADQ
jgi:hypothetical protein